MANRKMKLVLAVSLTVLFSSMVSAYVAIINKADHNEIHLVPAPGKVKINGDLKDWDLSGAILLYMDKASKNVYALRVALMYDKTHVYIGGHVKDPTPMVSAHHFAGKMGMAWDADAIQMRLVSNPAIKSKASLQTGGRMSKEDQYFVNHITLWYSTKDKAPGYYSCYTLGFKDGVLNPKGQSAAYKKDADGKGYTFEYKVPYSVLRAPRPWKGGDTVQIQFQVHWGNKQGTHVKCGMTDVRNKEGADDLGYMGPRGWGLGVVHAKGNLKLATGKKVGRAPGHIPVKFTLRKDSKVSLAITDRKGSILRTCLGAKPYKAGKHTYMWDGLNDYDQPLGAGTYYYKLLTHDGIKQKYVCDVGVSGTPPYQDEEGAGGWAGDYACPWYVDADDDIVVLGTGGCEAAPGTIGVSLEGRKLWGVLWGSKGPWVLYKGYGYFLDFNGGITRFDARKGQLAAFKGAKSLVPVIVQQKDDKDWQKRAGWGAWGGMTVVGGLIAAPNTFEEKIYLIDPETGQVKDKLPLARPTALATGPKDQLYALSNGRLGRYSLKRKRFAPITRPLDQPRMMDCDAAGNIYVALQGRTHQVWKFSRRGKVRLRYGAPGGRPATGKFNPKGMLNPYDIAVDRNGRLWVCEADGQPKRYSVWNPDGSLWQDFFGSLDYSTRATVDPAKPEHVYMQSVRYLVDYDTGDWTVDATVLRPSEDNGVRFGMQGGHGGGVIANVKGRKFFWTRDSSPGPTLYEWVNDRFVPRMAFHSPKKENWWLDDNNDGRVQPEEIRTGASLPGIWLGHPMDDDLNFYWHQGTTWANQGGAKTTRPYRILRWDFLGFNKQGGLRYGDPSKSMVVAEDPDGGAVSNYTADDEGNVYVLVSGGSLQRGQRPQGSGHRVAKFNAQGEKAWEYHNVFCAFAWTSEPYSPGFLVGVLSFPTGSTKDLIAVTGYYGQYFLLDIETGLFVTALGEDQRSPYTLDHHMVLTENFNGTLWTHPKSGKTYFSGGDADCRIWEIEGLDAIRYQDGTVKVTNRHTAQARLNALHNKKVEAEATGKKVLTLPKLTRAAADGRYDEWTKVKPQMIIMQDERSAQAQVAYDRKGVWVRFQVTDDSPLRNQASDFRKLFKTGDMLEIQIATKLEKRPEQSQNRETMMVGDMRVMVARTHQGKMVASIIRYKTAGNEKPNRYLYQSPVWKQQVDEVVEANQLPMHCKATKQGYVVEIGIPWAEIGVAPRPQLALLGDVGVQYGNKGGTRNAIRYLWADKSPEITINNDVPSEMRMHPNDIGKWILE